MSQVTTAIDATIDRYIAIWNEADPVARRALIDQTWAEQATYQDPVLNGSGRDGIDAMTGGFQAAYPDHTFSRAGEAEVNGNELRFGWSLANAAGEVQMTGSDVAVVDESGLLVSIVGTFDTPVPGNS